MVRSEENDEAIDLNVEPDSFVTCSVCLDFVTFDGDRSCARLKCGHQFHLDCIGSAFNMKGMMQCPNCRTVEKGRWLYSSGSTNSSPELGMDDGIADNFPFYFTFAEMPYRVHICPVRGFTQVHPSSPVIWCNIPGEQFGLPIDFTFKQRPGVGVLSTSIPMIAHQHPVASSPHPHPNGWVHFQHNSYLHQHQAPGIPIPTSNPQRSMPRFMPSGQVYEPNPGFSHFAESSPRNYPHVWNRDTVPHFPIP